jgi:L-asparaginase II
VDPITVAVRRRPIVESVHRVHAVAVQKGAVVAEAGNAELLTSLRSAAKPFQALPRVRARADHEPAELAIACASHQAEPPQLAAVRSLLGKAGSDESELECGSQDGRPPGPLFHNCSGKHAGMLAVCRARGWPTEGYRLPAHPLQRTILALLASAAAAEEAEIATALDGCGVVCFALPLERVAFIFSRLESLAGGARVAAAMRAHPELVGGEGALDTALMKALPGWAAKRGAEGLVGASAPGGTGIALKVEDGNPRALRPALAAFLGALGHPLDSFARVPLVTSGGERAGELVAV